MTISTDVKEMLPFATRIGARYFGRRNTVEGELLVRLRAEQVFAMRHVAD